MADALGRLPWGFHAVIIGYVMFRCRKILKRAWRRRARKGPRPPVPNGVRFSIFQRDQFRCVYCGHGRKDGRKLHLDHYKPWWQVKSHDPKNFVTACDQCNLGKRGRIMKQPIERFISHG